jgi:hypothetical protein
LLVAVLRYSKPQSFSEESKSGGRCVKCYGKCWAKLGVVTDVERVCVLS